MKDPLSEKELSELASKGGLSIAGLLNPKSAGYKKMGLNADTILDKEAAQLIFENQKIMRRPLLASDSRIVLGFDADQYAAMI